MIVNTGTNRFKPYKGGVVLSSLLLSGILLGSGCSGDNEQDNKDKLNSQSTEEVQENNNSVSTNNNVESTNDDSASNQGQAIQQNASEPSHDNSGSTS